MKKPKIFTFNPLRKCPLRAGLEYAGVKLSTRQKNYSVPKRPKGLADSLRRYVARNFFKPQDRLAENFIQSRPSLNKVHLAYAEIQQVCWRILHNLQLCRLIEILALLGYLADDIFKVVKLSHARLKISTDDIKYYLYWFWNLYPDGNQSGNYIGSVIQLLESDQGLRASYQQYLDIIQGEYTIAEILVMLGIPLPVQALIDVGYLTLCQSTVKTSIALRQNKNKKADILASLSHKMIINNKLLGANTSQDSKKLLKVTQEDPQLDTGIIEVDDDV